MANESEYKQGVKTGAMVMSTLWLIAMVLIYIDQVYHIF